MSDLLTTPELSTKRAIEPPKRWRNRYWSDEPLPVQSGDIYGPGEYVTSKSYPSREIAEQRALEWMRTYNSRVEWSYHGFVTYLGAVEVSE